MGTIRGMMCLAGIICATGFCFAQDVASPKFVVFGGTGVNSQSAVTHGSIHFGASFEEVPPVRSGHFPQGFIFEGGYIGPMNDLGLGSAIFSVNYAGAFAVPKSRLLPFFTGGYTRLFGTGNAVNYGGGIDFLLSNTRAVRFEVRDYLRLSDVREHNVAFRLGYIIYMKD